jgi:galactan endo-1,6-beta-galactosidase
MQPLKKRRKTRRTETSQIGIPRRLIPALGPFPPMLSDALQSTLKAGLAATALCLSSPSAQADYTVQVKKDENRGVWEGWGCSLAWWGKVAGGTSYEDVYADLFFTSQNVRFLDTQVPGLGMNIVRYNIGGGGRNEARDAPGEKKSNELPWYKDIDGYWINDKDTDPGSPSWDWERDAEQRQMLQSIVKRGVSHVEFFSNAPMWWMNTSQSSAGGRLQAKRNQDFARYLATVTEYAQRNWGVKVDYLEPFNEPSETWWTYPKNQEGCVIPRRQQAEILGYLREELDSRGLQDVAITAADENTMNRGRETYNYYLTREVLVHGQYRSTASLVDKINVHGYNGLSPWRNNPVRTAMRRAVEGKPLWMSEYGDNDSSGLALAQSIMEDLNHLHPTAWVYWQPVEAGRSGWGLVNAHFGPEPGDASAGQPTRVNGKYYVLAHFSRFLRPGLTVLGSNDDNSVAAYDAGNRRLVLITLNYEHPQTVYYDLSNLQRTGSEASLTMTEIKGTQTFRNSKIALQDGHFSISASPDSIYSVVIEGVDL